MPRMLTGKDCGSVHAARSCDPSPAGPCMRAMLKSLAALLMLLISITMTLIYAHYLARGKKR